MRDRVLDHLESEFDRVRENPETRHDWLVQARTSESEGTTYTIDVYAPTDSDYLVVRASAGLAPHHQRVIEHSSEDTLLEIQRDIQSAVSSVPVLASPEDESGERCPLQYAEQITFYHTIYEFSRTRLSDSITRSMNLVDYTWTTIWSRDV